MNIEGERRERAFEHESLQDRASIVSYLKALMEGFENGAIKLSDRDGELSIEPCGLVNFSVQAHHKPNRVQLNLKISWRPRDHDDKLDPPKLQIRAANGSRDGRS